MPSIKHSGRTEINCLSKCQGVDTAKRSGRTGRSLEVLGA